MDSNSACSDASRRARERGGGGLLTQVGFDGVHVGVVPLAGHRVWMAVAIGKHHRREVCDYSKQEEHYGTDHPTHLCDAPCQRQHPGPYHRRDHMRHVVHTIPACIQVTHTTCKTLMQIPPASKTFKTPSAARTSFLSWSMLFKNALVGNACMLVRWRTSLHKIRDWMATLFFFPSRNTYQVISTQNTTKSVVLPLAA